MLPNRYVLKRLLHVSELEYVLASSDKCHRGPSLCGQGRLSVRKQVKGRAGAAPLGRGPPAGSPGEEQRQSCQPRLVAEGLVQLETHRTAGRGGAWRPLTAGQ